MPDIYRPDFRVAVQLGRVPGWRWFRSVGHNPDADLGTEDVWPLGTINVPPPTAAPLVLSSASAADAAAGTGAREVFVTGLDAAYRRITETVQLNGPGAVSTSQSFLRVNDTWVTLVGSGGTNAGDITGTIGGTPQMFFLAGSGQVRMSQYTVPAEHTWLIVAIRLSSARQAAADLEITGSARRYNESSTGNYESWRSNITYNMYEGSVVTIDDMGIEIPEKADFRFQAISTGNNLNVTAIAAGYIVRNDLLKPFA